MSYYDEDDEWWDFRFGGGLISRSGFCMDDIRDELFAMKQDNFFVRKPRNFGIEYCYFEHWDEELLAMFVEVFEHFHEKRIVWEKLEIQLTDYNAKFAVPLLHSVNTMKIFKKIHLILDSNGDRHCTYGMEGRHFQVSCKTIRASSSSSSI